MDKELKLLLDQAQANGASRQQLEDILTRYNAKKKDSSESPSTGEEEATNTDSTPSVERDYPTPPTFITEKKLPRQDKAPIEYKPSFSDEERNAIYDEAGVPESQRPDRGDGVSIVIEKFALEDAARDRKANQAGREYEDLFKERKRNNPQMFGGLVPSYAPSQETTTLAETMSEEELSLAKENSRKEINEAMGFDESTSFCISKSLTFNLSCSFNSLTTNSIGNR